MGLCVGIWVLFGDSDGVEAGVVFARHGRQMPSFLGRYLPTTWNEDAQGDFEPCTIPAFCGVMKYTWAMGCFSRSNLWGWANTGDALPGACVDLMYYSMQLWRCSARAE